MKEEKRGRGEKGKREKREQREGIEGRRERGSQGRERTKHFYLLRSNCSDFFKLFSHTLRQPWHLAMASSWQAGRGFPRYVM